jgi:transposase
MTQARSVGVEHVGLHAASELGLIETLNDLGVNGVVQASIMGNLIRRMGQPGSELATWNWLQQHSALGELMDVASCRCRTCCLYRASDVLMKHREVIETRLFSTARTLFDLQETVTLYDLSNTYFEGEAQLNRKARRGRSKEKRSDCPLVTLGLVLDGSGFVRRSQTFAGNVSEPGTLASMLAGLGTPAGGLVVMDAGIATDANVAWLVEHGYRYLVVRRGGMRQFDAARAR